MSDEGTVEVRDSAIHGRGCFARRPIAAGERVLEYVGEIIGLDEARRRDVKDGADYSPFVLLLDEGLFIDARDVEQPARRVNHSCAPNCEIRTEGLRAWVVALRDIAPGEELTYDYDFEEGPRTPCSCGAPACRGYI